MRKYKGHEFNKPTGVITVDDVYQGKLDGNYNFIARSGQSIASYVGETNGTVKNVFVQPPSPYTGNPIKLEARKESSNGSNKVWLLIGQGREGYETDFLKQQGSWYENNYDVRVAFMNTNDKDTHHVTRVSDDFVNGLWGSAWLDNRHLVNRVDQTLSCIYTMKSTVAFSWDIIFDSGSVSSYNADTYLTRTSMGTGSSIATNTSTNRWNDLHYPTNAAGNNEDRIFTWRWGGHNMNGGKAVGFSQGNSGSQYGREVYDENHSLGHTEVYIEVG